MNKNINFNSNNDNKKPSEVDEEKRDFLFLTTTGLAVAGGAIAAW